jgi:hypothetical protein
MRSREITEFTPILSAPSETAQLPQLSEFTYLPIRIDQCQTVGI